MQRSEIVSELVGELRRTRDLGRRQLELAAGVDEIAAVIGRRMPCGPCGPVWLQFSGG